jgi:hypothetical protein
MKEQLQVGLIKVRIWRIVPLIQPEYGQDVTQATQISNRNPNKAISISKMDPAA